MHTDPVLIWQMIIKEVWQREIAETDSTFSERTGQPGGTLRELLRNLRDCKAGLGLEAPITHTTNEQEGD